MWYGINEDKKKKVVCILFMKHKMVILHDSWLLCRCWQGWLQIHVEVTVILISRICCMPRKIRLRRAQAQANYCCLEPGVRASGTPQKSPLSLTLSAYPPTERNKPLRDLPPSLSSIPPAFCTTPPLQPVWEESPALIRLWILIPGEGRFSFARFSSACTADNSEPFLYVGRGSSLAIFVVLTSR